MTEKIGLSIHFNDSKSGIVGYREDEIIEVIHYLAGYMTVETDKGKTTFLMRHIISVFMSKYVDKNKFNIK